jgi:probable HAF family extracellular repeat protein
LVGTWQGIAGDQNGFIEQPDGQVISFDAFGLDTDGSAINDAGTVIGAVCVCGPGPTFLFHGWVRSPDGSFTELDDPLGPDQTHPFGINDSGVIVGSYTDASGAGHGFVYDRGKFTTLDFPGSASTSATAINNSGTIVGYYAGALGLAHGFRYQNGKFTEIDAPGAGTNPLGFCGDGGDGTFPLGISAGGAIVGNICNDVGVFGWALSHGQFSPLNDPMSAAPGLTVPEAISENGRMVAGFYFDTSFVGHGLVATLTP